MLISNESATIDGRIELVVIDDQAWRVSDRQCDDARRVLESLERLGTRYELVWLSFCPGYCDQYDGITQALAAVSERMRPRMDASA